MKRRISVIWLLGVLVWALLASLLAGYFYYSYNDALSKTRRPVLNTNVGLNYGNGTVKWFNGTNVLAGETLLNATSHVAKVKYTIWAGSGAFVDSIDNITNSGSYYWLWWMYTTYGWTQGQVASDRYLVGDSETYYWYYEDTSAYPSPSPP